MFGRVVTLHVRLEKKSELRRKLAQEILPLLRSSPGFLQVVILQDETELDRVTVVSLWKTREAAQLFHNTYYAKVRATLEPFLTFAPALRSCTVDETISYLPIAASEPAESSMADSSPGWKVAQGF
jgi:quinol monooxygenase YgiN